MNTTARTSNFLMSHYLQLCHNHFLPRAFNTVSGQGPQLKPYNDLPQMWPKLEISAINKVYWTTKTKAVGDLIMAHCAFVEISCCSPQEILSDSGDPTTTIPVRFRASVALQTAQDSERWSPNLLAVQASSRYARPTSWGACPTIWRTLLCL